MEFYTKDYNEVISIDAVFPCILLVTNKGWNDYNYITSFRVYFCKTNRTREEIGEVKIIEKGAITTNLPKNFQKLDENIFCSLGQSVSYYTQLKNINELNPIDILDALNDISYYSSIRDLFSTEDAYKTSLLRFAEANKALEEGRRIIEGVDIKNAFHFTFKCTLPNAVSEHQVDFDFRPVGKLPNRLIAIIGKNGTGKTQFLATFANSLSGLKQYENHFVNNKRPLFSKVITVSYSLFDKFEIPKGSKSFSYIYCGLRDEKGLINEEELLRRYKISISKIAKTGRTREWEKFISKAIDSSEVEELFQEDIPNLYNLSSGQSILVYIITEIIANITIESLILYDEPETHLHPNAVSQLVDILYSLLNLYNSYAVIATHSPIIIQEIPSQYIYVFKREFNQPDIFKLGIESFGENLSVITSNIFENVNYREYYKKYFDRLSKEYSYEEVIEMFSTNGKGLGMNAKIYLKNLYKNKDAQS
ncbi:AAA family ATPase [Spirosoma harenae]